METQKKVQEIEIKVVLLGNTEVGKSSIISRFLGNEFNPSNPLTTGVNFFSKQMEFENSVINFKIWDTAGQERFRAITGLYYKDAAVAIIVYDIANKDSFIGLKEWVNEVKKNGKENVIMAIVGNKIDLIDQEQVKFDEARNYARDLGALIKLTSAKDDRGIKELFRDIGNQILSDANKINEIKKDKQEGGQQLKKESKKDSKKEGKKKECC